MKILIITGLHPKVNDPMSGIFITRRVKKLQEKGIDLDLIAFNYEDSFWLQVVKKLLKKPLPHQIKQVEDEDVKYKFLPINLGVFDRFNYYKKLGKLGFKTLKDNLQLSNYDLVHAHWVYPHGFIATIIKTEFGIPCVVSAHGSDIHTNPFQIPKTKPYVVYTLNNADKLIFNNSKLLETSMQLGYEGGHHKVIPNGVDTSLFYPIEKESIRERLKLPDLKSKYVGFVGNLKWVKRAEILPKIFKRIADQYGDVRFVVVGDGELRFDIEKECSTYNLKIVFKGRLHPSLIPDWMNALDVLILPSRREGFPNVVLEAQACGCPVVGTNVGGIPEAIGDGGIVVDEGEDFEGRFASAVIKILESPISQEILRNRAEKYDWDKIIFQQIKVYKELTR